MKKEKPQGEPKDIKSDGQQAGEVAWHGETLTGGNGPGWKQCSTPGSEPGRSGTKVKVRMDVNGY